MSDIAIRVEGLGKQYRIGGPRARYRTLRESVIEAAKAPFRRLSSALRGDGSGADGETIWALKDVSFEIERGEVVGIIGRNGAGKSTLLKVLSRITEPTEGWAEIHGRVGSLLEVGTGFHPELTGRENIYLSGAVLGMRREEIDRRFDEIVDFSGVEQFLDTPLKHYSSGMQVRLGFAVAAHLEPEILLVDEVLAVGDAEFQKKCLGKMGEVARGGRTVLFVSHNMAAVSQLCSHGVLLREGRLTEEGDPTRVIRSYLSVGTRGSETVDLSQHRLRRGTKEIVFTWAQLRSDRVPCRRFSVGDDITIVFTLAARQGHHTDRLKAAVQLRTSDGLPLCNMIDVDSGFQIRDLGASTTVSVRVRDIRLYPDTYHVSLWVGSITSTEVFDYAADCLSFEIVDGGRLTARHLPRSAGLLFLTPEWSVVGR